MVHEDHAAQVFFQPGPADYLVITYSNLPMRPDGLRFWGDRPLARLGIPALGFVAKRPRWFADRFMERALAEALPRLAGYDDRIAYGFSMGAYGAIRHAGRLGVRTVVAFSPQWTIDPARLAGQPQPYAEHFQPERHTGMELTALPPGARLYLLHDPHHAEDAWHAARIAEHIPQAVRIPIPFAGHGSVRPFSSTPMLAALLEAARSHDDALVRRVARHACRRDPSRALLLASHLRERRFALASALLARAPPRAPPALQARVRLDLARQAVAMGFPDRARALVEPALALAEGAKGLTGEIGAFLLTLEGA